MTLRVDLWLPHAGTHTHAHTHLHLNIHMNIHTSIVSLPPNPPYLFVGIGMEVRGQLEGVGSLLPSSGVPEIAFKPSGLVADTFPSNSRFLFGKPHRGEADTPVQPGSLLLKVGKLRLEDPRSLGLPACVA